MITTEIRYFFNELDEELRQNIRERFSLRPEGERTDAYLSFAQSATCGVKLREGRLEVKSLVSEVQQAPYYRIWEKISFALPNGDVFENPIKVTKSRQTNYFDLEGTEVSPESGAHCQLEVSEVQCRGQTFFSICLEAEAEGEELRTQLLDSLFTKLKEHTPLHEKIKMNTPKSYPEFLLELKKDDG